MLTTFSGLDYFGTLDLDLELMSGVDKTAKARQAHSVDMIMIGTSLVPVLLLWLQPLALLVFKT